MNPIENLKDLIIYQSQNNENISVEILHRSSIRLEQNGKDVETKESETIKDIEKYYGELLTGTYRIIKPVYDKEYIDIYSDKFEIT